MTDRDPAVEAAKRAEVASQWWTSGYQTPWDSDYAEDAAREALAPIRDLHKPTAGGYCITCFEDGAIAAVWPCDTARLIYTSEELTND